MRGESNEHLDDTICCFADRLDRRVYGVPRGGRANSLIARIRRDLVDPSLCDGETNRLSAFRPLIAETGGEAWIQVST